MKKEVFLELVEAKAKTASIFPFLLGTGYSLFSYHKFNLVPLILYFIAMLLFNCFVDAWDNYNDYHKAVDTIDYKQNTNVIGRENISEAVMRKLLAFLFVSSLLLGIIVSVLVGWQVFALGLVCYFVGVFYSGGPKPMSAMPIGEVLSGVTMGYLIFLICVFINAHEVFQWDGTTLFQTFWVSLPNVLLIANLMLANNTCDLEEDERNHRYTIVHYIGRKKALVWWKGAIILSYIALFYAAITGETPWLMLLNLLTIPIVVKISMPYLHEQVKQKTFICSVKILALLSCTQSVLMILGVLIG